MQLFVYFIPNLLTTGTLFGGFYSILAAMDGQFTIAALAILVASVFDMLDGRIARMINKTSSFGAEYDSLADMVSFGVAPAILVYIWMVKPLGKIGWCSVFLYCSCAALRLARFNVINQADDRGASFIGVPSPLAAITLASIVWTGHDITHHPVFGIAMVVITICIGLLMISNFRYPSFKDINIPDQKTFGVLVIAVSGLSLFLLSPAEFLLLFASIYILHAPLLALGRVGRVIKK